MDRIFYFVKINIKKQIYEKYITYLEYIFIKMFMATVFTFKKRDKIINI